MRAARRAASVTFAQANRWTASGTNGDVGVCIMEESLMAAAEQEGGGKGRRRRRRRRSEASHLNPALFAQQKHYLNPVTIDTN